MHSIAEFKRRMAPGTKVNTQLYYFDANNQPYVYRDYGVREVSIRQSNSFALATPKDGEMVDSYCEWPKAKDVLFLPDIDAVRINFPSGYLIYSFKI